VINHEKDNLIMDRSYQITPRDPVLGGGWNLALFDQGETVGGGVFPLPHEEPHVGMTWWNSVTEDVRAHWLMMASSAVPAAARYAFRLAQVYDDARAEADQWMNLS
jgi:hypothetical protein